MKKIVPHNTESKRRYDVTTFTWTIKNFEMCPNSHGKPLKSPEFSTHSWQASKFHLLLYARGINQNTSDHVSVYLVRNSGEGINVTYSCELGIMTAKGKMTCFGFNAHLQQGNGKGLKEFVGREKLLSTEKDNLLPDGNLTVFCEISAQKDIFPKYPKTGWIEGIVELSKDFSIFYEQEKFCDLELCTEDKTFKVHKTLLDIRFPGLSEKVSSNASKVENIGTSTMDALLNYVYGGVFDKNQINLFELVKSPYEVPRQLKSLLITKTQRIHATTCFEKKIVSFSWKIQDFNSLTSESFTRHSLIGDENCTWTWFSISLRMQADDVKENLIFAIDRFSSDCSRMICKIEVFDLVKIFEYTFQKGNRWTLPDFFTKKTLLESVSDECGGEVCFDIEITVTNGCTVTQIEKSEFSPHADSLSQLRNNLNCFQEDLKKLFTDLTSNDIKLLVGEEEIPAHKFVLCARSSVFSEMFQNQTSENEIVIEDFDSEVIKAVLLYMYCGEIEIKDKSPKFTVAMYNAANKYALPGLKNAYTEFLKSSTNENSAGDILIAAANWNDDRLKEHVYEFACNFPQKIATSEEWKETMTKRHDLALELLNKTLLLLSQNNSNS